VLGSARSLAAAIACGVAGCGVAALAAGCSSGSHPSAGARGTAGNTAAPVAIETMTTTILVTSLNQPVTVRTPPAAKISAIPRSAIGKRDY
jgi:hypothetical protein